MAALADIFSTPLVSGSRRGDAPLDATPYRASRRTVTYAQPEVQDQYGRLLAPTFYAHAPKGGVTIKGQTFAGGQFIPAEVLVDASPEERAAIESGESRGKPLPPEGGVREPKQPSLPAGKSVQISKPLYRAGRVSEASGGHQALGAGVYLAEDPDQVKGYGGDVSQFAPPKGKFVEVAGDKDLDKTKAEASVWAKKRLDEYLKSGGLDGNVIADMVHPASVVRNYLEGLGFKGVRYVSSTPDDHHDQVLVFRPETLTNNP